MKIIIIDHDSIPGFMMPMTMPFNFKKKKDVEKLSPGDSIRFTLVVKPDDSYVTNFTILGKSILLDVQDDFWDDDEFKSIEIGESLTDIVLLDLKVIV